jgi:hypothetical protein
MLLSLKEGAPIQGVTAVPGGNYTMTQRNEVYSELSLWEKGGYRPLVSIP